MFENECKILTELHHPNIVPVLATGSFCNAEGNSYPYMVMKFIAGQSLRQKLDTQGKFSWNETFAMLNDVGGALQYLFEKNFCHRDIKPANIVFDTETKHWVLVDFGIAKTLQDNIMATMTMAGGDSGTWDYMPPEQLEGRSVDIRCDIYALGTVAWEALIGTVPRRGTKLPAALRNELPADVDVLIAKMVEHYQDDRYQTPADVLKALHDGAEKIEKKIRLKQDLRKISRYGIWTAVVVLLLGIAWITGDFLVKVGIDEIVEKNKSSATVTLREVGQYMTKVPLGLGRRHWESVRAEWDPRAEAEKAKMIREYAGIKPDIERTEGSDQELETRKIQCENFIQKWGDIFTNDEEIRYAAQQKQAFEGILNHRSQERQLKRTIAEAKKITTECAKEQANFRRAISECSQIEAVLTFDDLKQELRAFVGELKRQAVDDAIRRADQRCADGSGANLFNAYQSLREVKEYAGDDEKLLAKMNEIDDRFWNYCFSKAEEELKKNNFSNARKNAKMYEDQGMKIGMTRNLGKANGLLKGIEGAEEEFDWSETVKRENEYLNDKAFRLASNALNNFERKYPNTKVKISDERKKIATHFATYISSLREALDDCQEQFDEFVKLFSMQNENIPHLQQVLCYCVSNEIYTIMSSRSPVKKEELVNLKYTRCTKEQRKYLDELKTCAIDSAVEPENKSKALAFLHKLQRPPKDCGMFEPFVYRVTITELAYEMSDSDYKEYKGDWGFDADIWMTIQGNTGAEEPFRKTAPVNCKKWSWSTEGGEIAFWVRTDGSAITVRLDDKDLTKCGPSRIVNFNATDFSRSGEQSHTFESGTKIKIKWTSN